MSGLGQMQVRITLPIQTAAYALAALEALVADWDAHAARMEQPEERAKFHAGVIRRHAENFAAAYNAAEPAP